MNRELLENIAVEYGGLELVATTCNSNGYPSGESYALIGFETLEDAEHIASENGLSVQYLERRDGWNMWYRTGDTAHEEYMLEDFFRDKDDITIYNSTDTDTLLSQFKELVNNCDSFQRIKELVEQFDDILSELDMLDDDEFLVESSFRVFDTYPKKAMSFSYDTHNYAICIC